MMTASRFDDEAGPRAELNDPANTVRFMLAGNAHVTFQSRRTGARFTYQIRTPRESQEGGPSHFVSLLTGSDNETAYEYLGCIYRGMSYAHGRNSHIDPGAPGAVAFMWVWARLRSGEAHPDLAVWHEGRCGACGRRLTTPESISRGLGPECARRHGTP